MPPVAARRPRRRAPARLAPAPAPEPARPRARGGRVGAPPELRRDRPLAAERGDGPAPGRAARRAAARPQRAAAGGGLRARVRRSAPSRSPRWRRCARRSTASCRPRARTRRSSSTAHWDMVAGNRAVAPAHRRRRAASCSSRRSTSCALSLHPDGVAPRIANLGEWRAHLLDRLGRQVALDRRRRAGGAASTSSRRYPAARGAGEDAGPRGEIAVPLRLRAGDGELSFLSTVATFGTATSTSPWPSCRSSRSSRPTRPPPRRCGRSSPGWAEAPGPRTRPAVG